jgi:hypothetical protein
MDKRAAKSRCLILNPLSSFLACVLLTAPAFGSAPTTVHSAEPATQAIPASVSMPAATGALDQSSPKALLRTLLASGGELDETQVRSLYHAANPVEQKTLDGVVQVELANARLRAMERAKFGKSTTRPSSGAMTSLNADALGDTDLLIEKIEGDKATVSTPRAGGMSMQFVRVDGKWKLPIASLVGKLDPAMIETLDAVTRAQVGVIDGITSDVKNGKLTRQDQVREELKRRLAERLAAATRSNVPTATTAPAVQPKT